MQKNLKQLKQQFKSQGIYIYECAGKSGCGGYLMLHQKFCLHCNQPNEYFDQSLKVKDEISN